MLISILFLLLGILFGIFLSTFLQLWMAIAAAGCFLLLAYPISRWFQVELAIGKLSIVVFAPLFWLASLSTWYMDSLQTTNAQSKPSNIVLKQPVEAIAFVNKTQLRVEKDKLVYTLIVRYQQTTKVKLPKVSSHPTFHGPFIMPVSSPPKVTTKKLANGGTEKQWKLTLVPVQTGPLDTPRFVVKYTQQKKVKKVVVPSIALEVSELKKVNEDLTSLAGSRGPILPELPEKNWNWWLLGGLSSGLTFVSLCLFWLLRREATPEPEMPPHLWFEKEMNALDASSFVDEEKKKYYFRLSEIFRGYLERRFRFPALENTSEEIHTWCKTSKLIDKSLGNDIRRLLNWMDDIKFAGYVADEDEQKEQTNRLFSVVRRTLPTEEEPTTPESQDQEGAKT